MRCSVEIGNDAIRLRVDQDGEAREWFADLTTAGAREIAENLLLVLVEEMARKRVEEAKRETDKPRTMLFDECLVGSHGHCPRRYWYGDAPQRVLDRVVGHRLDRAIDCGCGCHPMADRARIVAAAKNSDPAKPAESGAPTKSRVRIVWRCVKCSYGNHKDCQALADLPDNKILECACPCE